MDVRFHHQYNLIWFELRNKGAVVYTHIYWRLRLILWETSHPPVLDVRIHWKVAISLAGYRFKM